MSKYKVIVSGGGTGGHIYPAIAVADTIRQLHPDAEILFVGANGKMEMEKVPNAGYDIVGLDIVGLQRKLTLKNLLFPIKLLMSLRKAKKIIKSFQPDVVIGFGGFASAPILRAATSMGVKTVIQEQNSFAGKANKWLSQKVDRICVAYDGMDVFFPVEKIVMTGNPVREEVVKLDGKRDRGLEYFALDPNKKTILVIGGSLGARTLNESVQTNLELIKNSDVQVIWQTGSFYYRSIVDTFNKLAYPNVKIHQFISKMDYAYACADIIISRAGAISISELSLVRKPVILVPSPNVAEDHQTKNAMALVNHSAALLIKDSEAIGDMIECAIETLNNDDLMFDLSKNITSFGKPNSARAIADEALRLTNK